MINYPLKTANSYRLYLPVPILKFMTIRPQDSFVVCKFRGKALEIRKIFDDELENYKNCLVLRVMKSGKGRAISLHESLLEPLGVDFERVALKLDINSETLIIRAAL